MRMKFIPFTLLGAILYSTAALSQTVALAPGAKYVSMGSSFAAGNGVEEQLGTCGRSTNNYSSIVAAALDLDHTDVSCSGATTDHIRNSSQNGAPLQIEAVTADTELVTVTIGGNDIRYTASTFACSGTPAAERCTANLDQAAINQAISELPGKLGAMFEEIRAKAPGVTIVLVTYPRVFPVDAVNCSELSLSREDTNYLLEMGQTLEDIFVDAANSHDVLVADPYVLAAGHGPCAANASDRWINGQTILSSGIRYHPTAEGHAEMARLVLAALGRS